MVEPGWKSIGKFFKEAIFGMRSAGLMQTRVRVRALNGFAGFDPILVLFYVLRLGLWKLYCESGSLLNSQSDPPPL